MKLDIHEGKRVLYKHHSQWNVGTLTEAHNTKLTSKGLFLSVIPIDSDSTIIHDAEINDLFLDAVLIEEWVRNDPDHFMSKEEYITLISEEDFERANERAWVSDGEYCYYPVSKITKNWLEKQPFDFIVRE